MVVRRELRLHLPKKGVLVHRKTDHAFVRRVASTFSLTRTGNLTGRSKINSLSQNLKHQEPERERSEKEAGTEKKIDVTPIKE